MDIRDNSIITRLASLRIEINKYNYLYYVLDRSEISDEAYDQLMQELKSIENRYPDLVTEDSPTQRVGATPSTRFTEIDHPVPLLSLGNVFNNMDLENWYTRTCHLLGQDTFEIVCELKMDGLAVALTYQNGILKHGSTRGDGFHGENVTPNLRTIGSIPLSIANNTNGTLEVRGEVYFPISSFTAMNKKRVLANLTPFSNPRNSASGSLRQLDPNVTSERPLDMFIYGLGYADGIKTPNNHWDTMGFLQQLGFKTNPNNLHCANLSEVKEYYHDWLSKRETLDYATDGIVIKVNRFDQQTHLGNVTREPKWAIAYKFPSEQAITRLTNIGINVGRTGSLNPYAILEPVSVGGVTIKTATLHNEDYITEKDIRIGDWVIIQRAGEVIPQVVNPIVQRRTGAEQTFSLPTHCPKCNSNVIRQPEESMHYCTNDNCAGQALEKIKHFVSKDAMDIAGMGEKLCENLLTANLIHDISDIYKITADDIMVLDKFAELSANKIIDSIERSKTRPLSKIIFGLGILHVGSQVSKTLASQYLSLEKFSKADRHSLLMLPSVGPKIANSVTEYFSRTKNMDIIRSLENSGLSIYQPDESSEYLSFTGVHFVLTGKLESLTRSEAAHKITTLGGVVTNNVTKNTDFVLSGKDPGSKLQQAINLEIRILSEEEFLSMIDNY